MEVGCRGGFEAGAKHRGHREHGEALAYKWAAKNRFHRRGAEYAEKSGERPGDSGACARNVVVFTDVGCGACLRLKKAAALHRRCTWRLRGARLGEPRRQTAGASSRTPRRSPVGHGLEFWLLRGAGAFKSTLRVVLSPYRAGATLAIPHFESAEGARKYRRSRAPESPF